jgi:adenylate kinase family enzyme
VRRILVYGVSGSGKSTLARRIGERLDVPYHSIDDLTWEPGWVQVPDEVQRERVTAICAGEAWVIDSAYGIWRDVPLARADLIVGLDLPRWRSLAWLIRRTLRRIARPEPICNGNRETFRGAFLRRDSIVWWHFQSFARKRRRMRAWRDDPSMPPVVLLHSAADLERWLAGLDGSASCPAR